jgi:hypothetical protein
MLPLGSPSTDQVITPVAEMCRFISTTTSDGPYGNFAGRDASRGMAKQSFDLGGNAHLCRKSLMPTPILD